MFINKNTKNKSKKQHKKSNILMIQTHVFVCVFVYAFTLKFLLNFVLFILFFFIF